MFKAHVLIPIFAIALLASGASARSQDSGAIIKRGKQATAFVETSLDSGTAFCIDAAGYFVTSNHVVENIVPGSLKLVLNPTEANQKVFNAEVVRSSIEADLAILKAEGDGPFVPLDLGDTAGLLETARLTAVTYPLGKDLATEKDAYPAVTVSVGRVTSLRRSQNALNEIQLDAALTFGAAGGPVLNEGGKVVGIVRGGLPGAALNFATPVERLRTLIATPVLTLSPSRVPFDKRGEPTQFVVQMRTLALAQVPSNADNYAMELTLPGNTFPRTVTLKPVGDGKYVASAPLIEPSQGLTRVHAMVTFANNAFMAGDTADAEIRVGGKPAKLSQIARIETESGKTSTTFADGKVAGGKVEGFGPAAFEVGGTRVTINLAAATRIEVAPPEKAPETRVTFTVNVRNGTQQVGQTRGSIMLTGAPAGPANMPGINRRAAEGNVIHPPALASDSVVVKLPAPAGRIMVAGSGRYLLLDLPRLRQLALFDVNTARIVRYVTMPSRNFRVATGADKVVVLLPDENRLERWDLETLTSELSVSVDSGAYDLAMGYASAGPIMLLSSGEPLFYDLDTLRRVALNRTSPNAVGRVRAMASILVARASADGTTFAVWSEGSSAGPWVVTLQGNTTTELQRGNRQMIPSSDGAVMFTASGMILSQPPPPDPSLPRQRANPLQDPFRDVQTLPAVGQAFFVGFPALTAARLNSRQTTPQTIGVYGLEDRRLLFNVNDVAELTAPPTRVEISQNAIDQRVFLIPSADLLITVPEGQDELKLRRVSIQKELEKTGADFLLVSSLPARTAQKGKAYRYAVEVKSRNGGVQYRLDSGPEGMRLNAEGVLTWNPSASAPQRAPVIVAIRDRAGQEIFHNFVITTQ